MDLWHECSVVEKKRFDLEKCTRPVETSEPGVTPIDTYMTHEVHNQVIVAEARVEMSQRSLTAIFHSVKCHQKEKRIIRLSLLFVYVSYLSIVSTTITSKIG